MRVGAAAGGLVLDATGSVVVFATSSAVMILGAIVIFAGLRTRTLPAVRRARQSVRDRLPAPREAKPTTAA